MFLSSGAVRSRSDGIWNWELRYVDIIRIAWRRFTQNLFNRGIMRRFAQNERASERFIAIRRWYMYNFSRSKLVASRLRQGELTAALLSLLFLPLFVFLFFFSFFFRNDISVIGATIKKLSTYIPYNILFGIGMHLPLPSLFLPSTEIYLYVYISMSRTICKLSR